jgi:hypothetical protein
LCSFEDPELGFTEVSPIPTAPKKLTGKKNAFIPSNHSHSLMIQNLWFLKQTPYSQPPRSSLAERKHLYHPIALVKKLRGSVTSLQKLPQFMDTLTFLQVIQPK